MLDYLTHNWGNLASVAGLVFSFLAFLFSKRASTSARQARDHTLRQTFGEEMNSATKTAREIVTHVTIDRADMALLRVGELMDRASYYIARWDNRLSERSKNNLLAAREQLTSIHDVLTKGAISDLAPRDKRSLAQSCQRVSAIFSEEYGTAVKGAEIEEQHGN